MQSKAFWKTAENCLFQQLSCSLAVKMHDPLNPRSKLKSAIFCSSWALLGALQRKRMLRKGPASLFYEGLALVSSVVSQCLLYMLVGILGNRFYFRWAPFSRWANWAYWQVLSVTCLSVLKDLKTTRKLMVPVEYGSCWISLIAGEL